MAKQMVCVAVVLAPKLYLVLVLKTGLNVAWGLRKGCGLCLGSGSMNQQQRLLKVPGLQYRMQPLMTLRSSQRCL